MFFNKEGWPVITPYRYAGETMGSYTKEDLTGTYKYINHERDISSKIREFIFIELKKDGKITGDLEGTWELKDENNICLTIDGDIYQGVVLKQWDEDGKKYVMVFTALNAKIGISVWGSGLNAVDKDAS